MRGMIRAGLAALLLGCASVLVSGILVTGALAQPPPDYSGFDHVEIQVEDTARSLAFYQRLFGGDAWRDAAGTRLYLALGKSHLVLAQGMPAQATHFGLGIRGYDAAQLQDYLAREGIAWQQGAAALEVEDGDGIRLRLRRTGSWSALAATLEPLPGEARDDAPIFAALDLDEVGLSVTDLEVDALFYARVLGRNSVLQAGSLWHGFGNWRLRLNQTPAGQQPGIAYFGVLISTTDLQEAADAVFAAGGIIEDLLPNGFSFWDPDGNRVMVRSVALF
ncbi:MAG TPA: VOC family protein [Hyphomicrobiales bacterium]|nr:VOC family protein [Hyphomicrobiales bacterium]